MIPRVEPIVVRCIIVGPEATPRRRRHRFGYGLLCVLEPIPSFDPALAYLVLFSYEASLVKICESRIREAGGRMASKSRIPEGDTRFHYMALQTYIPSIF
jgi:hypothetical protein